VRCFAEKRKVYVIPAYLSRRPLSTEHAQIRQLPDNNTSHIPLFLRLYIGSYRVQISPLIGLTHGKETRAKPCEIQTVLDLGKTLHSLLLSPTVSEGRRPHADRAFPDRTCTACSRALARDLGTREPKSNFWVHGIPPVYKFTLRKDPEADRMIRCVVFDDVGGLYWKTVSRRYVSSMWEMPC
jgi:hypothetical protein